MLFYVYFHFLFWCNKYFWFDFFFDLKDGSFILAGSSFQIVGSQILNDLGPNVTVLVLGMYSCPEVADRNCLQPGIAETTMQSAAR